MGYQKGALGSYIATIADGLGYFDDVNLTVKLLTGNSTSAGIDGLHGGAYQFYLGGPESLVANQKSNAGLKILCATGNRSAFAIISGPNYPTVESLKGQTFAVSSPTSISTVTAQQALEAQGLSQDAFKLVVVGSSSTRYAAMKAGQVAGTTLAEPLITEAKAQGFHDLGYTDVDLGAPTLVTGTVTAEGQWASSHKDVTQRFLQAIEKATQDLYDASKRDQIASILAKGLGIGVPEAKSALEATYTQAYRDTEPPSCEVDQEALMHAAQALQSTGELPKDADLQKLVSSSVDMSYAQAAYKAIGGSSSGSGGGAGASTSSTSASSSPTS